MALDLCKSLYKQLKFHVGHHLDCVTYGDSSVPEIIALECVTCGVVLLNSDLPDPLSLKLIEASSKVSERLVRQEDGSYRSYANHYPSFVDVPPEFIPESLWDLYGTEGEWNEHDVFGRDTWGQEASENNTTVGYWEWVEHQIEATEHPAAFYNHYNHCGQTWQDVWSSQSNGSCPICNAEIEPFNAKELTVLDFS